MVLSGYAVFSNLTKKDVYKGSETKYNITVVLSDEDADMLAEKEVQIKNYGEENPVRQRKFSTQFVPTVVDVDGEAFAGEVPRGSLIKIMYKLSPDVHPVHGTTTYLERVRVLELGTGTADDDF